MIGCLLSKTCADGWNELNRWLLTGRRLISPLGPTQDVVPSSRPSSTPVANLFNTRRKTHRILFTPFSGRFLFSTLSHSCVCIDVSGCKTRCFTSFPFLSLSMSSATNCVLCPSGGDPFKWFFLRVPPENTIISTRISNARNARVTIFLSALLFPFDYLQSQNHRRDVCARHQSIPYSHPPLGDEREWGLYINTVNDVQLGGGGILSRSGIRGRTINSYSVAFIRTDSR